MVKEKKSVFDSTAEALNSIAENLEGISTALYVAATELVMLHDDLKEFMANIDKRLSEPLRVTVDLGSFIALTEKAQESVKPKPPEQPALMFKSPGES